MKNILLKATVLLNILILAFLLTAQTAKAETLEEQLNNLTGPKNQYNTALSPVYLRNNTVEESVSTQSGDLSLSQTDYVLPGRNGLDLTIKRLYKSGTSNIQEMKVKYVDGAWVDYAYSDAKTSSFYEERYNLGIGMRFSFPAIEVKKNEDGSSHKYLHTESGDVYRLIDPIPEDTTEAYVPENQTIKDITVNISADFNNGQTDGKSKYVMSGKDGKKTYFSDDGRILGIVDRYGNTIKFEYTALDYTVDRVKKSRKLISKITDTIGRVTTIEYKEDQSFVVGPANNTVYSMEESYKTSQNPNTMYSGDLAGKFQVIVHLPGNKDIVYDKTAALVSGSKHVLRTRLQRVFDVDGKPKYHFWYEQPSLGFSFTSKSNYSAYNTYENLVQIDYCRTNRIKRYTYNTFTKGLSDGSMQYRKIFEKKELVKKGYDSTKSDFLDRFVCDTYDKTNYSYTNEPDGFNFRGYIENNEKYLKDTYRYYTSKTDLNGTVTKYTFDGAHEQLETEEAGKDHRKITLTENDEMKFPKKIQETLYNMSNGQVIGQPSVKIENFRYDQYGNLTNYTGPLAKRDDKGYPTDNEYLVVYSYAYDKFHTLSQKSWKQDKDTSCQIINTIDEKGNVTREQKINTDDPKQCVNIDYLYDSFGNITQKTVNSSDNTYVTKYEYGIDADGNDLKGAYLTREYSVVNGVELAKKHVYDPNTGNIKADIDENGNRTSYEYDSLERIAKITYADKSFKQYTYKDSINSNREVEYLDQKGSKFLYEYDILDNVLKYSLFDNNRWNVLVLTAFDFKGNKVQETDSNGNITKYTYDSNNRLTGKIFYDKSSVKKASIALSYTLGTSPETPLILTMTDEDGYDKKYYYDAAEQLVRFEETPDKTNYCAKTYTYNYMGNMTSETDALNATTEFVYDNLGRLVRKTDALKNETVYQYNSLDKTLVEGAPGGKITQKIYDTAGREIEVRTYTKGSPEYYYEKTAYDKAGNITNTKEGKVSGGKDSLSSETDFTFDNMNRMTDEYRHIAAGRREHIRYEYDSNGNRTRLLEYADQTGEKYLEFNYAYDFAGNLTIEDGSYVGSGSQDKAVSGYYQKKYTRDYEGNILTEEQLDGESYQATQYTYDYRNRQLTKIEPYTSDGKTKQTSYVYDKRGNTVSETLMKQGVASTLIYRFDGRSKLIEKTDATRNTIRYLYDENGNLKKEIDARYYGLAPDIAPGTEYTYDPVGRLEKTIWFDGSNRKVLSYKVYDGRGNVTKDVDGEGYNSDDPQLSAGKTYEYDAADMVVAYRSAQMAKDNVGAGGSYSRVYAYDGSKRVVSEQDSNGGVTLRTYYLNGLLKETLYPDRNRETYEYDDTGKLTVIKTDRGGNKTSVYNNVFGKAYRIIYPDKTEESFKYTSEGFMKESTDRNGNISLFEYDPSGNVTSEKEFIRSEGGANYYRLINHSYDEMDLILSSETFSLKQSNLTGQELSKVSAGDKIRNVYDNSGRLTSTYGPFGRETINRYDAAGNLACSMQKISDGSYRVTRSEYDSLSRKVKESLLVDISDLDRTQLTGAEFDDEYPTMVKSSTSYTYYANGLVKSTMDARGNETVVEYDLDGRPVKKVQPMNITSLYRYDTEGNLISETNGRGISTYYDYDSMNKMIRKRSPAPMGGQAVTRYIYDAMGNLLKTILPNEYDAAKDTPELAASMAGTAYKYDSMNRPVTTIAPTGETVQYISYDANGNVRKKVDGLRYKDSIEASAGTTYEYDGLNRVIKMTDELGGETTSGYDVLGNVVRQTDELKHVTSYAYNPDGTVAKVTQPDGGTITYSYDNLGRMTSRKDQRGFVTSFSYSLFDKVKEEKDPCNNTIKHKYDLEGNECATTDKRGSTVYISYDALNRPAEKRTPLVLDEAGNTVYGIESYIYDEAGNLSARIQTGSDDPAQRRETSYTYYDNNQVMSQSDNSGSNTAYFYDNSGNLTRKETLRDSVDGAGVYDIEKYTYDSMNRMTQSIRLVDENDVYNASSIANIEELRDMDYPGKIRLITGYSYDMLGNKISEMSPIGFGYKQDDAANRGNNTVKYYYDELNRLVRTVRKYNGKDISFSIAYDASGNRTEETNERGYTKKYTYDTMNRLKTQTDALDSTITYDYDAAGNRTSVMNAKGYTMTYSYDRLNREENVTDAYGTIISRKLYDANGNVVKSIEAKGYLAAAGDDSRYGTLYTYDLANRLTSISKPEAAAQGKKTESYAYNVYDDKTLVIDALGNTTTYEYDNKGNLTKVTDALGITTTYGYDRVGNKLYTIDGRGKTTEYLYNGFGEIKSITDAEGKSVSYQYDLAGNLAHMLDRNGTGTIYSYDNRNQLLEKKVESTTGCSVRFTYDDAGNRSSMTDASGIYTYSYDKENRLEQIRKNGNTQISYTYDILGNISKVTDSLGYTVGYAYDKSSRMETVSYAGQSAVYAYDKNGNRESVTYSSGIKEQFRYDRENKLLELINSKPGGILSSFTYTYDLAGKQLTKRDSYGTSTYTYDADGRIMREETPGKTAVYSYDKAGNRVSMNETYISGQPTGFVDAASGKEIKYILKKAEYIYSASNRLMKLVEKHCDAQGKVLLTKNTVYIYDDNGNQLRQSTSYISNSSIEARQSVKGSSYGDSLSGAIDPLINRTSNTFDGFNRLIRTEQIQGGTRTLVDYTYNGDDLRVGKTVRKSDSSYAPETTVFLYDRQHVILETNAAGSLSVRYIRGVNYLAREGSSGSSGSYSVLLYNGHGDIVQTADENGNIQNSYDYDIWGNPTLTIEQYSCSIRYAGEFFDKETGLYYLRARYYNPYTGRFISEDSYWGEDTNPLSLNLYTYCKNDPIQFVDPSGHSWISDLAKKAKTALTNVSNKVTKAYNNVKTTVKNTYNSAKTTATKAYNSAKTTATKAYNSAKTTVTNTYNSAKTTATNTAKSINTISPIAGKVATTALSNKAKSALTSLGNTLNSIAPVVKPAAPAQAASGSSNGPKVTPSKIPLKVAVMVDKGLDAKIRKDISVNWRLEGQVTGFKQQGASLLNGIWNASGNSGEPFVVKEKHPFLLQNQKTYTENKLLGKIGFEATTTIALMGAGEAINVSAKGAAVTSKSLQLTETVYNEEIAENMVAKMEQASVKSAQTVAKGTASSAKWVDEAGNIKWPANNGAIEGTEKNVVLQKGYQFDRYGKNSGSYVSPVDTPFEMRSLAPGTENTPYKVFEVVKPVRGQGSVIAPWFDQPGGGIQFKLNNSIDELLNSRRITEVGK